MTPVTMSRSPNLTARHPTPNNKSRDLKLSPGSISSPDFPLFGADDDFGSRLSAPMKQKDEGSPLKISTSDSNFPISPYLCASPYWGSFGVSATPKSARPSNGISSPNLNRSPPHGSSSTSNEQNRSEPSNPQSYRVQNTAPILIAPNPLSLRPATRPAEAPYRDNSYRDSPSRHRQDSTVSLSSVTNGMQALGAHSQGPSPQYTDQYRSNSSTPMPLGAIPSRRKRKSPPRGLENDLVLSGEISQEEQVLIELVDNEALPWKEVAQRFNELTGKNMKVPALQMRKKRLRERLRVWTDLEVFALLYFCQINLLIIQSARS